MEVCGALKLFPSRRFALVPHSVELAPRACVSHFKGSDLGEEVTRELLLLHSLAAGDVELLIGFEPLALRLLQLIAERTLCGLKACGLGALSFPRRRELLLGLLKPIV